jgi:hypothetical protein
MKSARLILLLAWSVAALPVMAREKPAPAPDPQSLEEVIAQRGEILAKLLESAQLSFKEGTSGAHEVHSAALELYAFRRDTAKSKDEKIEWQKKLVATEKEHASTCEKRIAVGVMNPAENLRAKERVLAAQQRLFELQAQP